ncbi:YndJ family transporter [Longispora sp. NPDC051575]|uniref:YndJ family transporter n=1 Tax=Longispora sp. NPDC051575 TaxID=3154943 RepID=UPI0034345879
MTILVNLIVTLGMLVILPLGLRLLHLPAAVRTFWPLAAVPGAISLWLPRGATAAGLAAAYLAMTLIVAFQAGRRSGWNPRELAVRTALVSPAVAAAALLVERTGVGLFAVDVEGLARALPQLHYAGFTAALVAGLIHRTDQDSTAARIAALTVPIGAETILIGYFVGGHLELVGALVLTTGMWFVGWLMWRDGFLFKLSSAVLAATVLLAVLWAAGEAFGTPGFGLTWLTATHGVATALGLALCGLLAWKRNNEADLVAVRPQRGVQPAERA